MNDSDRDRPGTPNSGRVRWLLVTIGFTVGASLAVALGALVLFFIIVYGDQFIGSERSRSLLALLLFVALISIPAYVLAISDPFGRFR
ncbi:hypothetical protein [Natronomonas sp.]|uniref:hypothetical protein n=1 Tax=Natronomonas sp. TaxID=2184060 RepID=UPI0039759E9C